MKRIYREIWDLALKYQDVRDDKGHAEITLSFALKLLDLERVNPDVVIPAMILHDIGWSQLPEAERFLALKRELPPETKREIRFRHQEEGVKLAKKILDKVGYDKELSKHILEIISQHDTREGVFSPEDAVVRDADSLWVFSREGCVADIKRMMISEQEQLRRLEDYIDKKFFTELAINIARNFMEKRRKEFRC